MNVILQNSDVFPINIKINCESFNLQPKEKLILETNQNGSLVFELKHHIKDKFNSFWYIMNDIFTLEQMRTVLVVDGVYNVNPKIDNSLIEIRNHEYVFNKNISYDVFVFKCAKNEINIIDLEVDNSQKILNRSKILYLFGGGKTLFPLCFLALIITIIRILIYDITVWQMFLAVVFGLLTIVGLFRYLSSINLLKKSINKKSVIEYMSSERKEFRKFTDDIVEKSLYGDSFENFK